MRSCSNVFILARHWIEAAEDMTVRAGSCSGNLYTPIMQTVKQIEGGSVSSILSKICFLPNRHHLKLKRELYLLKYKLGSHRAIWGNSMTMAKPTIITSTKGMIER
jgi:hypothetical protein